MALCWKTIFLQSKNHAVGQKWPTICNTRVNYAFTNYCWDSIPVKAIIDNKFTGCNLEANYPRTERGGSRQLYRPASTSTSAWQVSSKMLLLMMMMLLLLRLRLLMLQRCNLRYHNRRRHRVDVQHCSVYTSRQRCKFNISLPFIIGLSEIHHQRQRPPDFRCWF